MSKEVANLTIGGKSYTLPIVEASTGEKAIDIRSLLKDTGYITLDNGFMNTGSCQSNITYLNGDLGVLNYRGYPIEELADNCSFIEVAYLILLGELPNYYQLEKFKVDMNRFALLHEDMIHFFDHFPPNASPMSIFINHN